MEYVYQFANASLCLRVIGFLNRQLPYSSVTVVHHIEGWIIRIRLSTPLSPQQDGDFQAFLKEVGIPFVAPRRIAQVFRSLEQGDSPTEVMQRYQIAVVSHGRPEQEDIEAFRQPFIEGLGYCPEYLA